MANHGQLNILTPSQETAIRALGSGMQVAEIVRITWPAPDGIINYAWWQVDDDPAFAGISTWLDGRPLIPAFIAEDGVSRLHEIPKHAAVGDNVVQMRFTNQGRDFEELCYKHRGGVRVEFFYYIAQLDLPISQFVGVLRTPDSADTDFVNVSVANGLLSNDLIVPNRHHASNCMFHFGGELTAAELVGNPCDYDRHLSGTRGTLNGAQPWATCEHTKDACQLILGDLLSYGGDDSTNESTLIGGGEHKTVSTTVGAETRAKEPIRVIYGKRRVRQLVLLRYAKEINPSPKHPDKGTLRTLFEISEGRVKSIGPYIRVMERPPQGLMTRLGAQGQAATDFSPNVLSYNRRALMRVNLNPIDPSPITVNQITGEADCEGRDEVKVYSDETTFAEQYTNNRAWCLLDLITNKWFGLSLDTSRTTIDDWIYLAGKGVPFDCDAQSRTAYQQIYDICLAGGFYLPFWYNGVARILPIEDVDLQADDIPVFSDQGTPATGRNILFQDGVSRLTARYVDDDKIPNSILAAFEDADHGNIDRVLTFDDFVQQRKAGKAYGDFTKRKVPVTYAAYGLTHEADVTAFGKRVLNVGPFGHGGVKNNLEITLAIDGLIPEGINLHQNKIIEVDSPKLDIYLDEDDNPFRFFIVKALLRNSLAELIVTAQAFASSGSSGTPCTPAQSLQAPLVSWTNLTLAISPGPGQILKNAGVNDCSTNSFSHGDSGGRTVESIEADSGDWELNFSLDTTPSEGRAYVGLTTDSGFTTGRNGQRYCIHVSDQLNTIDPFAAHSIFVYENGSFKGAWEGVYSVADRLTIRCVGGVVTYYHKCKLLYTSLLAPTFPLYGAASLACLNHTVDNVSISFQSVSSGGTTTPQTAADSGFVLIDRLWRDQELAAGVPGIYVAAGPENDTDAWPEFELYRDAGAGYQKIHETEAEAIIGVAATVLAGTEIGSETVDVDLRPGQALASYTAGEVAAGAGLVYLGGEIFQYQTATQQSTTPNRWRLSVLSNRGAKCTAAFKATHAVGDQFASLNPDNVIFVPLASSEIGQTRNYKGLTGGQALGDVAPVSFQFNAPNFKPTTPADYNASFDSAQNQIVHTWTPVSDPCLAAVVVSYEIRIDASGSPGALLWSGTANEWREAVSVSATRMYHFRAKTIYANGSYVTDSVTFTVTPGGGGSGGASFRASARVATTGNISLTGLQTIDGVSLNPNDRVLPWNQTNGAENGIYIASAGTWARATDFDDGDEVKAGAIVTVEEGLLYGDRLFILRTNNPITVGVTILDFALYPNPTAAIEFVIDGGGAAITTGQKGHLDIPFDCVIDAWTLVADQVGSIVLDVWKDSYANFPPTVADSITASAKPTISSAQKAQSSTLTGWTTTITAGDVLAFNVDSVATVQRVTLSLKVRRT